MRAASIAFEIISFPFVAPFVFCEFVSEFVDDGTQFGKCMSAIICVLTILVMALIGIDAALMLYGAVTGRTV